MYTNHCCGMIAMKREVAALPRGIAGFPWSECQEGRFYTAPKNLTASHCTNIVCESTETRVLRMFNGMRRDSQFLNGEAGHTRKSVQSPLVVLTL